ncbi:MAG: class II aldolase/adducin family protein, partial [Pseudomonadota bacterium]
PDHGPGLWITPTGMAYDALTPEDCPFIDAKGAHHGPRRPSSEWRFHYDILMARRDVDAVLHAHSRSAMALSCLRRPIPAFHYMVAAAGGPDIRCAPYALFGTQALSDHVLAALDGRRACLMANHGVICLGSTIAKALALLTEVETLANAYLQALAVGPPVLLSAAEMDAALDAFATYGAQAPAPAA